MRTYRLAYLTEELARTSAPSGNGPAITRDIAAFDEVVATLRHGDPGRPLFVPKTDAIAAQFAVFDREWAVLKPALERAAAGDPQALSRARIERFVGEVNAFVATLEQDITRTTSLLRTIQLALVALAIVGALALIYLSFLFIIRPVHQIEDGLRRMAEGDFSARVPVQSKDEFGALAEGFNHMAAHLEESYRLLEGRVAEKTRSLAEQNARLATLYDMTAFLNAPNTQEELCRGFLRRLLVTTGAAAGAVRLVSRDGETLHLFVEEGLPASFAAKEHCLQRGECACGEAAAKSVGHRPRRSAAKRSPITMTLPHCREAGFALVSAYPIAAQHQVLGVYNLFHRELREIGSEERHMLDSLGQHLGVAIESLRLVSSERELAIAERAQPARAGAARLDRAGARVPEPAGPDAAQGAHGARRPTRRRACSRKSRRACRSPTPTSASCWCISAPGPARATSSTAFARCSPSSSTRRGYRRSSPPAASTVPLAPDTQLQAMHILQEALSNVRKHAGASRVDVELVRGPGYRFVVRDDGRGFDPRPRRRTPRTTWVCASCASEPSGSAARCTCARSPGGGTEVVLTLPVAQREAA